jgi:hypothetical protein
MDFRICLCALVIDTLPATCYSEQSCVRAHVGQLGPWWMCKRSSRCFLQDEPTLLYFLLSYFPFLYPSLSNLRGRDECYNSEIFLENINAHRIEQLQHFLLLLWSYKPDFEILRNLIGYSLELTNNGEQWHGIWGKLRDINYKTKKEKYKYWTNSAGKKNLVYAS